MEFHDFTSLYSIFGDKKDHQKWYQTKAINAIQGTIDGTLPIPNQHVATAIQQYITEAGHYRFKKPYYNIYPDYIDLFMETKLHVPTKLLRLPFPSILIRFPKESTQPNTSGHPARTMLISEHDSSKFLIHGGPVDEKRRIQIWIDIGEKESEFEANIPGPISAIASQVPVLSFINLSILDTDDDMIEDAFLRLPPDYTLESGIPITKEFMRHCVRIVSAVCFLATGADKLVQPDVLAKDQNKYQEADPERQKQLADKAIKRGKHGFTVGKESVIGQHREGSSTNTGTGKELTFSHLRSGHFHVVWYGPGKTKSKVVFFSQTRVKPDLPIKPTGRRTKVTT